MKVREGLIVLLLAAGVCACATPGREIVAKGRTALAARSPVPIATLTYTPLPFDENVKVDLDDQSPVVAFGEQRSFARGFSLPESDGTLALSVRSYRFGSEAEPAIVYPEIRLLDAAYSEVEVVPAERFVYRTSNRGDGLSADFFVDPKISHTRYLLVTERRVDEAAYAVAQINVTSQTQIYVPARGGFLMWFLPTGHSAPPVRLLAAPAGRVELTVNRYQPRRIENSTQQPSGAATR